MRINSDTRDALIFVTGLLGMVSQGVLWAFGITPSPILVGAYLTCLGTASISSMLGGQTFERRSGDSDDDPSSNRKRRADKRKGGSDRV